MTNHSDTFVENGILGFPECEVSACGDGVALDVMQPGETREYQGYIYVRLKPIGGLCATSAPRELVRFEYEDREHDCSEGVVKVRVTLNRKSRPARVQPALHVVYYEGAYGTDREVLRRRASKLLSPNYSHVRESRTVLPLWRADRPLVLGSSSSALVQPKTAFRGQRVEVDSTCYNPAVYITELRAVNVSMWSEPVPAGIFLRTDAYEPPAIDLPTMTPANRFLIQAASVGKGSKLRLAIHGQQMVDS